MNALNINETFINYVRAHKEDCYADYLRTIELMNQSTAIYKGETVPFLYQPMFFTTEDVEEFKRITRLLMSITKKVVNQYEKSDQFRKKFGYSPLLEELTLIEQGYSVDVPIGRFDLFYGGVGKFQFCEFNTDGSSAMNEDNTISRVLMDILPIQDMKDTFKISYFELFNRWVEESVKIYNEFNPTQQHPNIAIVDFDGIGTPEEFKEFQEAYLKKGYNAIIVDPRELRYEDGGLYFKDLKIDLVYRRMVTRELIARSHEIEDFIRAYKDQSVCVVGSLKSQIMHDKIIFKVLHDEDTLALLTDEEQEFIKKHIPFTDLFDGDQLVFEEVLKNKDRYVIKPRDLYASKGVYVGQDFTMDEWKLKLKECWEQEYLYQEFCVPYTREFVEFQQAKLQVSEFRHITGLYVYNEKLAGLYTRIGKGNIISGLYEYYTLSNMLVR